MTSAQIKQYLLDKNRYKLQGRAKAKQAIPSMVIPGFSVKVDDIFE